MPCTFNDRLDGQGRRVLRAWLDEQPLKVRLKIDQMLRSLAIRDDPRELGFLKKISGYEDVFELVVTHNKVQYRPLGGYGPRTGEFTFVLGAIEHNDNLRPSNGFATAEKYVAQLRKNELRVDTHEYEPPAPRDA